MSSKKEVATDLLKKYKLYPRLAGTVLSASTRRAGAFAMPLRAQIETTTVCNLKCRMCPLHDMSRKRGKMAVDRFRTTYDAIKPAFLSLTGRGETLTNDGIFEMVSYGKRNGSFAKFDTNGMLLDSMNIDRIIGSGLDLVSVSLDGARKETDESIRIGSDHDAVLHGLTQLIRQRDITRSKLQIHVGTVLQAGNLSEFMELVELGNELGVDKINARPVEDYGSEEDKPYGLKEYMGELESTVERYLGARDRLSVEVDVRPLLVFLNRNKHPAKRRKDRVCLVPWYSTYVTWEGDVYPCCYYYDGQVCFGNVFDVPFGDIWNSQQYREFRNMLRDHRDSLAICKSCKREERLLEF